MDAYYYLLALLPIVYAIRFCIGSPSSCVGDLQLPPGPWQLPVIGSLHHLFGALPHRALRELSRRHGPLMLIKVGRAPVIIASSADAAKEIMKTHDSIFCTRPLSSAVKVISKRGSGITFSPYGEHWRQLRKICFLELLSAKRIQTFRPAREEEAMRLMKLVSSASSSEPHVNMSKMIFLFVNDTTVHAILGNRFKDQDILLRYIDEAVGLVSGFTLPDLFPSSWLAHALSSTLRKAEAFEESLVVFMDRVIGEHLDRRSSKVDEARPEDLIDVLLRIKAEDNLQIPLTMNMIQLLIFDLVAGGTETATTTLQWAMAELMRNPRAMCRAQAEIRGAFMGQMKVTEEGLRDLDYFKCIIKETLRLHTPGPLLLPKQCQEQCKILGYDVPKGTTVLVNAWAISRDPEYWDEPEAFMPERFEGSARDFKGNSFEYTPFGAGRRICPGMFFGLANIELALANLLFYFDWSLPDGILPGDLDMTETMGITARKKEDLRLRATRSPRTAALLKRSSIIWIFAFYGSCLLPKPSVCVILHVILSITATSFHASLNSGCV